MLSFLGVAYVSPKYISFLCFLIKSLEYFNVFQNASEYTGIEIHMMRTWFSIYFYLFYDFRYFIPHATNIIYIAADPLVDKARLCE